MSAFWPSTQGTITRRPLTVNAPYEKTATMQKLSAEAWRLVALAAITASLLAVTGWLWLNGQLTVDSIKALVAPAGVWAPLAYVVLASLLPVAFVPRVILTIAAAALFGFWQGVLLGTLAGMGGAMLGYGLGWKLGNPWLQKHGGKRAKWTTEFIDRHDVIAVLLGRVCPVMSCEVVSLASGIAGVRLRSYVIASVLGILPGSILYSAFGASLVANDGWATFWSFVVFAVLSIITVAWFWLVVKKDKREDALVEEADPEEQLG